MKKENKQKQNSTNDDNYDLWHRKSIEKIFLISKLSTEEIHLFSGLRRVGKRWEQSGQSFTCNTGTSYMPFTYYFFDIFDILLGFFFKTDVKPQHNNWATFN